MAVVSIKRRRTYAGEEAWFFLLDEPGPVALRQGLIACGLSPTLAGNIVWWLVDQRSLDRHMSAEVGVKYRRILAELDPNAVARAIPG